MLLVASSTESSSATCSNDFSDGVLLELRERLLGVLAGLGEDHPHVARLRLAELGQVLVVEGLDLVLADLRLGAWRHHIALDLVEDQLQGDPLTRLLAAEAGVLEEALELLLGSELLVDHALEPLVDGALARLDPALLGLAEDPAREDQVRNRRIGQRCVLRVVGRRHLGQVLARGRLHEGGVEVLLGDRPVGRLLDHRDVAVGDAGRADPLRRGDDDERADHEDRQDGQRQALAPGAAVSRRRRPSLLPLRTHERGMLRHRGECLRQRRGKGQNRLQSLRRLLGNPQRKRPVAKLVDRLRDRFAQPPDGL